MKTFNEWWEDYKKRRLFLGSERAMGLLEEVALNAWVSAIEEVTNDRLRTFDEVGRIMNNE